MATTREREPLDGLDIGQAVVSRPALVDARSHRVLFDRPCLVCAQGFHVGDSAALVVTKSELEHAPRRTCDVEGHTHGVVILATSMPRPVHERCCWVFERTAGGVQ